MITIAHRLNTIADYDKVIVMDRENKINGFSLGTDRERRIVLGDGQPHWQERRERQEGGQGQRGPQEVERQDKIANKKYHPVTI